MLQIEAFCSIVIMPSIRAARAVNYNHSTFVVLATVTTVVKYNHNSFIVKFPDGSNKGQVYKTFYDHNKLEDLAGLFNPSLMYVSMPNGVKHLSGLSL